MNVFISTLTLNGKTTGMFESFVILYVTQTKKRVINNVFLKLEIAI